MLNGRADWERILDRWNVALVAITAENEQLAPFLEADPDWQRRFADEEGAVYRRIDERE